MGRLISLRDHCDLADVPDEKLELRYVVNDDKKVRHRAFVELHHRHVTGCSVPFTTAPREPPTSAS